MDVGVIGTGVMGKNHVRIYSEMKSVDDLLIYDTNVPLAKEIAGFTEAKVADSVEDLLNQVDAVSICVPTQYHYETAVKAAEAGVNMLIEKPICHNSKKAGDLCNRIEDGIVIGVGHIERFNPIVREIEKIIKNPLYVEIKRHNPASTRITGTSVVFDLMIHDIDIIFNNFHFTGPYNLTCSGNDDVCSSLFDFHNFPVYLSTSRKSSKKLRMIYIEEEDFTIEGNYMTQEVYIHRKPERYAHEKQRYVQENIIEKVMVNKVEPLKVELSSFIDCAKKHKAFNVEPRQAADDLRICEEIVRRCG